MDIHFSTLRSVCKHGEITYRQWNEDRTTLMRGRCCEHSENPEGECKEKFCPLKKSSNARRKLDNIKSLCDKE